MTDGKQMENCLRLPDDQWPQYELQAGTCTSAGAEERRNVKAVMHIASPEVVDCTRVSSWRRLLRITAYVLRFARILKSKIQKNAVPDVEFTLTPSELSEAEKYWVIKAQQSLKPIYEKGEFKALTSFLDDEGVLRVGGRAENLRTSYESKHPAPLPSNHHVSFIITRHMHELGHHGIATTTAKTRIKFWILQGPKLAKTIKFKCVVCRMNDHKNETQMMADLPDMRMASFTPPFHFTAIDYFGPIAVKVSRNKTAKYYGVIFTCLNTRAVHLELAVDCSTM
ncbi:uncharacterized protein LOC135155221 [Lytechinus pictus]|uniref:uncharacterized protein LOC135155221 n=1 Tax=Lytechinus pictus TaxID=7653 RepID=UPI0030BA0E24